MENPKTVSRSPDRQNIFYSKKQRLANIYSKESFDKILAPIASALKDLKVDYPLTIIYMPLKWCGYAYRLFENILGENQYYPIGGDKIPKNRLFAQFHSRQDEQMKALILIQIVSSNPTVRVIFSTSALGMGVDAPGIRQVIHIGPPYT